ncbi:MAG: Fe-S cluster assembly protein SufD [Spartobacteria bacterium AMD-G4]|nr:MAG: Fe-S cluster assembly protein SufD [Spartobacteria bacterium AMD-G4]
MSGVKSKMSTTLMENTAAETSAWPAWFVAEQSTALEEYENSPTPSRKDESWRFANLKALDLSAFVEAQPVASEGRLINASTGLAESAAKLVLGNNTLLHRESSLPEGVIFETLETAASQHADLFKKYFMAQPVELGSRKYAALHKARLAGGAFLFVPANTSVQLPIEIFQWVEGANASVFPHTLIVCGENSSVTVLDYFKSADKHASLACGVNDLHLAAGAKLTYVSVQDWSRETTAFHLNSTSVDSNATCTALIANFGGGFVRGESLSRLVGEGSRSEMYSINPVEGTREIDQRTLQDHVAPHATSDLLYLNALDDKSRTIFAGLIKVEPGAKGTDAYQKVKNLILSDDADPNSMPGLEILNDEVRCSHGATNGPVSQDELFYMQARGITRDKARRLIVNGFFNNLLARLENETLRAYLEQILTKRLAVA